MGGSEGAEIDGNCREDAPRDRSGRGVNDLPFSIAESGGLRLEHDGEPSLRDALSHELGRVIPSTVIHVSSNFSARLRENADTMARLSKPS